MPTKQKVIAVVGTTASGKTGVAVELAKQFNGEVISADSRQVYRELDIGTAKATEAEMQGVPHHLIDICDVNEVYTGADFVRDAAAAIDGIVDRGRCPIIAGGTFFYLQLLRGKLHAAPTPPNDALREELAEYSNAELLQKLRATDPRRAETIDPHNRRRLVRALEIVADLGAVPEPSEHDTPYNMLLLGLDRDKEDLRERFRVRAENWLADGIVEEVRDLLAHGVTRTRLEEIGFEYKLVLDLIDETLTTDSFIERSIQQNWQYAKRQLAWLKQDEEIEWYTPTDIDELSNRVQEFWTVSD